MSFQRQFLAASPGQNNSKFSLKFCEISGVFWVFVARLTGILDAKAKARITNDAFSLRFWHSCFSHPISRQ